MKLKNRKILNIGITITPKENILEEIIKYLKSDNKKQTTDNKKTINPFLIFTPNAEIISYAQNDKVFKRIVNSAQINIPDGIGINFALNKILQEKIKRNSGLDFMLDLCRLSRKSGFRIGLIGGRGRVALDTKECLITKCPSLRIEVLHPAEFKIESSLPAQSGKLQRVSIKKNIPETKYLILNTKEKQEVETEKYFQNLINEIIKRRIDILFVALGCPKQEYFISQLSVVSCQLSVRPLVMMAVGGSFDYISGHVKIAPLWMRENGLEWLYRLIQEPWRLGRMLRGTRFFYDVFKRKNL